MPVQFSKFKKIVIGVIFIIGIIAALASLTLEIIFDGGISGYISNRKPAPDPNSSAMIAKREAATEEINQSFGGLQNILRYNHYETSTHDRCSKGHSSWKRSDGYAYRCSLRITNFYGFSGDFRQGMIDFEQKINSIGWEGSSYKPYSMKEMLEEYYDNYETYQGTGSSLRVSRLPTPNYNHNNLSLELEFAEELKSIETEYSFISIESMQKVSGHSYDDIFNEENFQDIGSVIEKITNTDQFVLIISIQQNYFRN